jgi:adenosylcobinamide kinase/adenosylcobinamide-phosphate guanylyltransferase
MSDFASAAVLTLVTGPARSGKSEWAEHLAEKSGKFVVYVATARVDEGDREWQQRIQQHQQRRPPHWQTIAEPKDLTAILQRSTPEQCLLIDSLGTWLANLLEQSEPEWESTVTNLLTALQQTDSDVILVAEETGWGVVPAYPLGRQFRDRLGHLTRHIGAIAQSVYLVTGGHALDLRKLGTPLGQ